jgi:hypothetical protein
MMRRRITRRLLLRRATIVSAGLAFAPALIGRARAAPMKLRLSSSQANDAKYANGRVYYDNLVKHLKASGLSDQVDVQFFPDNQLGQEIDVINCSTASPSRPRRSRPAPPSRSKPRCSGAPISASSLGHTISARARCWRKRRRELRTSCRV